MLSRASRNAYSWWWASHIRTKQSKWLEQNIEDMEEKVGYILKIITEDGDSFRVRAEQYYRKRPEIVNFVEDTFREYRALAERYDHISKDLQSANRTIAVIFPERVQMSIDEEDYEDFPFGVDENENKHHTTTTSPLPLPLPVPEVPKLNHLPKMENAVQAMLKTKSKMPRKMMSKNGLIKIGVDENASRVSKSSGLSKDEALEEIDKLQKDILGLQTEKEFIKSSYENAVSKYWEIENNINEMHTRIYKLQDELDVGKMMEDNDAQSIMSYSALKMCDETLAKLKHKQKRFKKEATVEHKRVDDIRKKFEALIAKNNENSALKNLEQTGEHVKDKKAKIEEKQLRSLDENDVLIHQEPLQNPNMENSDQEFFKDIEDKKARIKDEIVRENEHITVSQVAEKIEQLADKVISLETEVTSQAALVMRLRLENDELHEHIQSLEQDKKILVEDSENMNIKIKRLEEQLERVQSLDHKVKGQNVHLETSFDEASVDLDNLSKDLLMAKPDEIDPDEKANDSQANDKNPKKDSEDLKDSTTNPSEKDEYNDAESWDKDTEGSQRQTMTESVMNQGQNVDWNLMFSYEVEDREKLLLEEYTSTLKRYKEVKKKLNEIEKNNRARSFKYAVQMKMLRSSNESKDAQLRSLHKKLKLFEANTDKTMDYEVKKALDSVDVRTQRRKGLDDTADIERNKSSVSVDERTQIGKTLDETADFRLMKSPDSVDERTKIMKELEEIAGSERRNIPNLVDVGTQRRKDLDKNTDSELKKAPDSVDEGTPRGNELDETKDSVNEDIQRRKEVDENMDLELNKPQDLVDEGTQRGEQLDRKATDSVGERTQIDEELDDAKDFELKKVADSDGEGTQRGEELEETILELKKASDSINKETQREKEDDDGVDKSQEVLEIEEEIRAEIEELRTENLELWLRFSTSFHQINRFQDSFNDLVQEIKEVKEKKNEHTNAKHRLHPHHHHQHHPSSFAYDIRPLYRHLQDMLTEVTLWLEKSGMLEDDLQHRLISLSDIQNELSDLTNGDSQTKKTLDDYQTAKFQGEVLNMKQENVKVIEELRAASKRVNNLQIEIEKTLTTLDEELGKKRRSNSNSKVPFRSFLFGVKLRKHKPSLFACMNPSLQKQYSGQQPLPHPKEES